MTSEQAKVVYKMINASITSRFNSLQEADKNDLAGYAWEQVSKYHKVTETTLIPNYRFCDCFVVSQAFKRGYIKSFKQCFDVNNGDSVYQEYSFGMTNIREFVSSDELFETTGWEPSVPSIETLIIERSERTVHERMIQAFLDNPWESEKIKSAIKHIENGGDLKYYATEIGMSGQTLKNRIQRTIKNANDNSHPYLPFN